MNWGRAKTILIIMFLVTDIFLLIVLMQTRRQTLVIPKTTITETVKILSNNRIKVQGEQIPAKRVKSQNMIMQNHFQNPDEVALSMLGTGAYPDERKPEEYKYQFSNDSRRLQIEGNSFLYRNEKKPVAYEGNQAADHRISAEVADLLDELGFSKGTVSLYNIRTQGGIVYCDAMPKYHDEKIYGIVMHITADSEAILTIEGNWFDTVEPEDNEPEFLLDVTAVLSGMALGNKDAFEIADISHGYYASDDFLNSREIAAVPVYIITDRNGQTRMYDARMGTKVE